MPVAPPQRARLSLRSRLAQRAAAVAACSAVALVGLPASPAHAVTKSTLWDYIGDASADYKASRTWWYTFPTYDRVMWSSKTQQAGVYLNAVRNRLSAASTQTQINSVATLVNRERTRARVFKTATVVAYNSFSARRSAISAGQNAYNNHLSGGLSDSGYAAIRADSAAVAALAAKDRRRAWAALLSLTAPAASEAKSAVPALSSSTVVATPAGWVGIPGGCAVQSASSTWLGNAGQPGVHLWVDDADVTAAQLRGAVGSSLARAAHNDLMHEADILKTPITTDLSAAATPMQKRSQRLGYAALMGDSEAADWVHDDLTKVLLPGPKTGNAIRDGIVLEGLATDLDWTGLDEAGTAEAATMREALLVRWIGPLSCRFDDVEATVVDPDNITIIVDAAMLHAALALGTTEPARAAALARTALIRLQPGLAAMTADGGSFEGPSYWNFQSQYLAAVYGTVKSVYGANPPLALPSPGAVPAYAWDSRSVDGTSLPFADSTLPFDAMRPGLVSWMAHQSSNARAGAFMRQWLQNPTAGFQVLWWPTDEALAAPTPERLSSLYRRTGLATLQAGSTTAWLKGGSSAGSHAHLDLGTVGYHRYGIQWAVDPGQGDYSLPEYSSRGVTSKRWTYWKVASKGHSTIYPTTGQPPLKNAPFSSFSRSTTSSLSGAGTATVDLRSAMTGASAATRTAALSTSGVLTVGDRISAATARQWVWGWVTEASISISGSGSTRTVTLSQGGHVVHLALSGLPSGSTVAVVSAPSGTYGPTGRALHVVTVKTGATRSLTLTAKVY
jgi:hypothetical protein